MDGMEKRSRSLPASISVWRPVLLIRFGRGRVGGSTILDMSVQRSRAAGRPVVILDGDLRNGTLSNLYPPGTEGVTMRPKSDDLVDMKDSLTAATAEAVARSASLVVDFGGGDRVMLEYGRELSLVEMCE